MNPTDLPTVRPGTQWWHTYAREWQNLFDLALRLANLRVGPGLEFSQRGRLATLRLTEDIRKPKPAYRRVAVQEIGETSLSVREVRYSSKPPVEGQYRWHGPQMSVYPAVGHVLSDFASHSWGIIPPTASTSVLDAYRLDEEWFVKVPGGGDQVRYVVAVSVASARVLTCRAVTRTLLETPAPGIFYPWDATWTVTGDEEPIYVEPGLRSTDYTLLMTPVVPEAGSLPESTAILPVIWFDGVWMVQQHTPWALDQSAGSVESGDCVP